MATSVTEKICSSCGLDVAGSKRVKDTQGRYFCEPCWKIELSAPAAPPPPAHADVVRPEKNPVPLIVVLSTVGSVAVLTVAWLLFFRPSWQDQHKAQLLDLMTEANSLSVSGRPNDAYRKYSDLFKLVGDNAVTDPDLQSRLAEAKASMVKLETVASTPPAPDIKQPQIVGVAPASSDQPTAGTKSDAGVSTDFGDQIKQFHVDEGGIISSDAERTLNLPGTDNKDFVLAGEMWLTSGKSQFDAGGVIFHLREADGQHRYELTAGGLRAKRVNVEGKLIEKFANPIQFSNVPRDQWVPFRIELAQSGMVVVFGGQRGEVRGPLTREGSNGIDLSAGGKIRNISISPIGNASSQQLGDKQKPSQPSVADVSAAPVNQSAPNTVAPPNPDQIAEAQRHFSDGMQLWKGSDYSPPDYLGAFQAFKNAAELGHAGAMYYLAGLYDCGDGTTADPAEAVKWLQKSWAGGYVPAADYLGFHLENGYGVSKDTDAAFQLYRQAAGTKDPGSMCVLANCYLDAKIVAQNTNESLRLLTSASDLKYAPAMVHLAHLYADGKNVPADPEKVHAYLLAAANLHSTDAMVMWGTLYEAGNTVEADQAKAFAWFLQAANAGDADAMARVGDRYRTGNGTEASMSDAVVWYRKAAEQGNAAAAFDLGVAILTGQGTAKDPKQALDWLKKSEDWGCDKAHDAVRLAQRAVIAMAIPHDRVSDYRKTQLDQYSKQLADARKQIRVLPVNSPERDEQLQVARNLTKQKSQFEDMTDDQLAEELAESDLQAIEQQQQSAQQADMDRRIEAQRLQRIQNIPNGKAIGQLMKDFAEALAYYRDTQVKYNRCIARLNVLLQGWDQVSTSAVADQAAKLLERLEDTNLRLGIYNKKLFDECAHAAVQQIFDAWADDAKMVKLREFVGWAN